MNYLIILVVLGILFLFLANPLLLQTENVYEKDTYGQGYNVVKDSKEATEEEEEAMEEAEEND